jgi:hypothetical protein
MVFRIRQKLTAALLDNITAGYEQGEWTIAANLAIGTPTLINNWTAYAGATVTGISHAAGVFTVTEGGIYAISLSVRFSNATNDKYAFIAGTSSLDTWFKNSSNGSANVGVTGVKRVAAGGAIRCYAYSGTASNAIHEQASDLTTGVTIYRLGP